MEYLNFMGPRTLYGQGADIYHKLEANNGPIEGRCNGVSSEVYERAVDNVRLFGEPEGLMSSEIEEAEETIEDILETA